MSVLKVCSKTIQHFQRTLTETSKQSIFISVKGGGCNGFKYHIEPTNNIATKGDETLIIDDVNIIVCGSSLLHLLGTELKWNSNVMGTGITFENPNASGKCGCGETFSI
jgi:iron-sulfur cluster assembly protein